MNGKSALYIYARECLSLQHSLERVSPLTATPEQLLSCGVSAHCRERLKTYHSPGKESDWIVKAWGHRKVKNVYVEEL